MSFFQWLIGLFVPKEGKGMVITTPPVNAPTASPIISIPSIQPVQDLTIPLIAIDRPIVMVDGLNKPAGTVSMSVTRDFQLSEHFTFSEMVSTQHRDWIERNYSEANKYLDKLALLCRTMLEPIISLVGMPSIDSGFRCIGLNAIVGGQATSQHCHGEAADTIYKGVQLHEAFNKIAFSKLPFGQVIIEFNRWVHVSITDPVLHPGKVGQRFVASTSSEGKTVYTLITKPLS